MLQAETNELQTIVNFTKSLVDLDRASGHDVAVTRRGENGAKSLDEIRFYGKKQALAFTEQTAKAESSEGGK